MQLYGRAVLYTGAPGQMVRKTSFVDAFKQGESKYKHNKERGS